MLARPLFIFHNHSVGLDISRIKNIRLLALDVDGILTDCRVWMNSEGEWRRFFSVRDGVGIRRLLESGYEVALITGSKSEDIRQRAKVLGISHLYEGSIDKLNPYEDLKSKTGVKDSQVAYMGDDDFDLPILSRVAFSATVPEAMDEVKTSVHYITSRSGGDGAAREVCDLILKYGSKSGGTHG